MKLYIHKKLKLNSPTPIIDEGRIINSKNTAVHFNKFFTEIGTNIPNKNLTH